MMTIVIGGFEISVEGILLISATMAIIAGFIYRAYKAARKSGRKAAVDETKKYIGRAMTRFDPILGVPMDMVGKAAVVDYVEDHFQENQHYETGAYGKEKTDF
jgi:hypothetical protein